MATILLADDHPDIVNILKTILQSDGHNTLTAYNGLDALSHVRNARPDLVILDVCMPDLDGLRVLNRIRCDPELQHTTVILLTVKDQPDEMALGLNIGANYYLTKPFSPTEVKALVRRIIASPDAVLP